MSVTKQAKIEQNKTKGTHQGDVVQLATGLSFKLHKEVDAILFSFTELGKKLLPFCCPYVPPPSLLKFLLGP